MYKLREARKKANLTQRELAVKAGIGEGHYSKIERGENGLMLDTAKAIANALDLGVDQIEWPKPQDTEEASNEH